MLAKFRIMGLLWISITFKDQTKISKILQELGFYENLYSRRVWFFHYSYSTPSSTILKSHSTKFSTGLQHYWTGQYNGIDI